MRCGRWLLMQAESLATSVTPQLKNTLRWNTSSDALRSLPLMHCFLKVSAEIGFEKGVDVGRRNVSG